MTKITEKQAMNGYFTIENTTTGEIRKSTNTIVSVGKAQMAGLFLGDINVGSAFDFLSLGLGSSTITPADTTLGSEAFKLQAVGIRTTSGTVTDNTSTLIGSFAIDAIKTINEIGIFNESGLDTGVMAARGTFGDLALGSGDQINATYNIVFN